MRRFDSRLARLERELQSLPGVAFIQASDYSEDGLIEAVKEAMEAGRVCIVDDIPHGDELNEDEETRLSYFG